MLLALTEDYPDHYTIADAGHVPIAIVHLSR